MAIDSQISKATDAQLAANIASAYKAIESLELELDGYRAVIVDCRAELDRRAMKAQGFSSGDKIIITQEFIDHKEKVAHEGCLYDLGTVWIINNVNNDYAYIDCQENGHAIYQTICPLSIAQDMRRAWLEREGQEQK